MNIGYARVSTEDQNIEMQTDALKKVGCELLFKEKRSGKDRDRCELNKLLSRLRRGDTVYVWKLDRLGRSLKDLIDLIGIFHEKGVGFISLNDSIDTTTPHGRFTFNVFASLAEFEREIIRERTRAGLAAARIRGRIGGRPKGLSKEAKYKAESAKSMYESKTMKIKEICNTLHISKATFYRYLNRP